jgi:hypothetical protein
MGVAKRPLSFLNPWFYSDGYKALTDIVDDGSTGCNALYELECDDELGSRDWIWGTPNLQKIVLSTLTN